MARLDLESNNQERDNRSEDILRGSEDATFSPPRHSGAIFFTSHAGGDLAQKVAEVETHHNSVSLVPSGHHPAPIKGRKGDEAGRKDKERVDSNDSKDSNDSIGELLFDSGLCSCCRRAASEDGPNCRPLPGSSYVLTCFGFVDQSVDPCEILLTFFCVNRKAPLLVIGCKPGCDLFLSFRTSTNLPVEVF